MTAWKGRNGFSLELRSCSLVTTCVTAFFFLTCTTLAQNKTETEVKGSIQDISHAAISGASVTAAQGDHRLTTATNKDGLFAISLTSDEPIRITVQAPGFTTEERTIPAASRDDLLIVLKPESVYTRVVVTGSRGPLPLDQSPHSIMVIPAAQIETSGALEIDDVLRQVAGFDLFRRTSSRTANPTTEGISMRGIGSSGASRALVLLDGVPVTDPFGGWMNWSQIPEQSIDSVEMLRGGASDLYGGQALSGVVQMLTRNPEATNADLNLSYGTENTANVSGYVGHVFGNWFVSGAGEYFRTDGYVPVEPSVRGTVDNRANSLHRNGELGLQRQIAQRSRFFVRGLAYDDSRHNGTLIETNRTRAWTVASGFDWEDSGGNLLQLRGYGGTENYHQTFASVAADRNSETLSRLQAVPSRDWGLSAQYTRKLPAQQTLLAGVDFGRVTGESDDEVFTGGKPTSFVDGGARNDSIGIFAEDLARISPRWLVTPVLRFDYWQTVDGFTRTITLPSLQASSTLFPNRSEFTLNPKLATNYQINDRFALRASVYRSFRSPTLNELYRSFRLGNVLTLDNPQLRAERLTGWEAGVAEKVAGGKLQLQQTMFWADVHRPVANVTLTTTPTLITRMRENLGSTRAPGVEAQIDWSAMKYIHFGAQYQFVDATVTSFPSGTSLVGLRVPEVPQHEFTFQASYSNPSFLTFAVQARTSSSVFDDDLNTLLLGSFFKLDAFVSRRLNPFVDIYLAGENLLDQSYAVARTPIVTLGPPLLGRVGLQLRLRR